MPAKKSTTKKSKSKTTKKSTKKKSSSTKKSTAKKATKKTTKPKAKSTTKSASESSASVASISTATTLNPDIAEESTEAPVSTTSISEDAVVAKSGLPNMQNKSETVAVESSIDDVETSDQNTDDIPEEDDVSKMEVPEGEKLPEKAFSEEDNDEEAKEKSIEDSNGNASDIQEPKHVEVTESDVEHVHSSAPKDSAAAVAAAISANQAAQTAAKINGVNKKDEGEKESVEVIDQESKSVDSNAENEVDKKSGVATAAAVAAGATIAANKVVNEASEVESDAIKEVKHVEPSQKPSSEQQNEVEGNQSSQTTSTPLATSSAESTSTADKTGTNVDISGNGNKDTYTIEKTEKNSHKKSIIIAIVLFLILLGLGAAYYYFQNKGDVVSPLWSGEEVVSEGNKEVDPNKSFENPINGVQFSQAEAAEFKDRKPVAVMVNNTTVARPSSGLSKADVIYEAVAEGGITRLMPIFFSQSPINVSSIRSARYYFVELASAYSPHYIHWGAAYVPDCQLSAEGCPHGQIETEPDVDAKARIVQLGVPNIDAGGYETACNIDNDNCFVSRDPKRVESMGKLHAGFVKYDKIFEVAREMRPEDSWQEYTPVTEWLFKDDAPIEDRGDIGKAAPITYAYWETQPAFNVKWVYNPETNTYLRYQGGQKQVDMETGEDLEAKVVVVRFTEQEPTGDYKNHLRHTIVGTGDALIFQDGEVINATWTRNKHDERDLYTNANGDQVEFVRGQIWVQLVPTGNEVEYGQPTLQVIESDESTDTEADEEAPAE